MTIRKRHRLLRGCGRDGFIIVAVLWILIALATLASVFSIYLANSAVAVAVKDDVVESELLVSSSLEFVAYQLLLPDQDQNQGPGQNQGQSQNPGQNQNQGQNQGQKQVQRPTHGAFRFRLGQATVTVNHMAETARIDLNAAPKAMLAGLFAALGAQDQIAEFSADRIIGWRTAPNPATTDNEDARYRTAGLSYGPRGAPFAHVDELWLVQGLPPALVERAMPFVTIYSGRAEINVFDAPPEVIAALPGMTPALLNIFLDRRESVPVDPESIPRLLGPNQTGATTEGSDAIRVRVRIAFDNGRQAASEVVVLVGADDEPYRVLSWRDDIDPAAAGQRAARGSR
jgi:general secretion pathway protein K